MRLSTSSTRARRRIIAPVTLLTLLLALLLCGCGGGSHVGRKTGKGAASFTIKWPAARKSARLIPAASNVVRIRIKDGTGSTAAVYGTRDTVRPAPGQPLTTTLMFVNLPPGQFFASATAYHDYVPPQYTPNEGANVETPAQATATLPLTIADGQTTISSLTMDTTVAQVLPPGVPPNANLTAGYKPFRFKPQARDSAGSVVILAGPLQVAVSDSSVATLTDNHDASFTISDASDMGTGTATVTVTEPESGATQSFLLTFAPTIFLSDRNNNRIARFDNINGGTNFTSFPNTTGTSPFNTPRHIATDFQNHLYIVDSLNNRLVRYDIQPGGLANPVSYNASDTGTPMSTPYGVALDSLNRIYITDGGNRRIIRIDDIASLDPVTGKHKGLITYDASENGHGGLQSPNGIAVDAKDRIYIADGNPGLNRIIRINDIITVNSVVTGSNFIAYDASAQGGLANPHGVAIDAQYRVYIADYGNNRIVCIDGSTDAHFMNGDSFVPYDASQNLRRLSSPTDVSLDGLDRIYIADFNHNYVIRIGDISGNGFTYFDGLPVPADPFGGFNGPFSVMAR